MSTKHKKVDLENLVSKFEKTYQEERNQETQVLYNEIVDVINRRRATIQNVLTALELVKATILTEKLKQIQSKLQMG